MMDKIKKFPNKFQLIFEDFPYTQEYTFSILLYEDEYKTTINFTMYETPNDDGYKFVKNLRTHHHPIPITIKWYTSNKIYPKKELEKEDTLYAELKADFIFGRAYRKIQSEKNSKNYDTGIVWNIDGRIENLIWKYDF